MLQVTRVLHAIQKHKERERGHSFGRCTNTNKRRLSCTPPARARDDATAALIARPPLNAVLTRTRDPHLLGKEHGVLRRAGQEPRNVLGGEALQQVKRAGPLQRQHTAVRHVQRPHGTGVGVLWVLRKRRCGALRRGGRQRARSQRKGGLRNRPALKGGGAALHARCGVVKRSAMLQGAAGGKRRHSAV